MNLNEHLKQLEHKARLKKKLIFGFSFLVIIIGILRFNDKLEREQINRDKKFEEQKIFQEKQKNRDSLPRQKKNQEKIFHKEI